MLALETSTSSVKAMVCDDKSGVICVESEAYASSAAQSGTQDADAVHESLLRAANRAASGKPIRAIALSSTWHSVCLCDERLQPITPVYTWEYTPAASFSTQMREDAALADALYRSTGCMPNVTYPRQTLLYLKQQGLSTARKHVISQGGYTFLRLTGEYAETVNIQSGGGFINLVSREYDPAVMNMLGMDAGQFGMLVTREDTAPLSVQAAAAIGIDPGIPVVPAHSDGACNQMGADCGRPLEMTLSVGTSAAIRMVSGVPVFSDNRETWCYCGVSGYVAGAAVAGACNCIDWFREELMMGNPSYASLEGAGWNAGAHPPVFLPFLFGERCPGWRDDRLAGFVDIRGGHDVHDLYHAVQRGILFNLLQCYEPLTAALGKPAKIVASGGILLSAGWCQMMADVLEQPVLLMRNKDASLLGAASLAMAAAGGGGSAIPACGGGNVRREVLPDAEVSPWYREQYARYLYWYEKS